ncbi:MAG TPA: amidohydrolase family protein [Candidatus Methylomirabilis sp.]|nr:amidohydrolase family protein [Candidatus Methylomirabilis sp.]
MSRVGQTARVVGGCLMVGLLALASTWSVRSAGSREAPPSSVVALVGGRVQASPEAAPIPDGVVLIGNGAITAVGPRGNTPVPPGATVIDCTGATVTSGFWNSHVHFMGAAFQPAETAPPGQLSEAVRAMLTSWGVVHAVDIGSRLENTLALRRRIESGEIPGPSILTAGLGFVPVGGSPYYILPAHLPELTAADQTATIVNDQLDRGGDVVKLFTGSWARRDLIVVMPVELVRAATEVAHRRGKLVFAHPSNSAGARAAIEGGVDILAHTFPAELDRRPWDRALPGMMRERNMALVPTLKLYPYELGRAGLPKNVVDVVLGDAQAQLRAFAELGGQVLFGTDVGYITDFDPTDEYLYMAQAGLSYPQILAALTTAPAARLGAASHAGRLAVGYDADVVVLEGDPAQDIRALARVRATLRGGRVIATRARS